jgi:hypothetical protein
VKGRTLITHNYGETAVVVEAFAAFPRGGH